MATTHPPKGMVRTSINIGIDLYLALMQRALDQSRKTGERVLFTDIVTAILGKEVQVLTVRGRKEKRMKPALSNGEETTGDTPIATA